MKSGMIKKTNYQTTEEKPKPNKVLSESERILYETYKARKNFDDWDELIQPGR